MADIISDQNLLFGILAVQLEFIASDQLIEAANAWMLDKQKSLGDILVQKGSLTNEDRGFLEQIVEKHVARTGSPKESLQRLQEFDSSIQTGAIVHRLRTADITTDVVDFGTPKTSQVPIEQIDAEDPNSTHRYQFIKDLARGGLGRVSVARDIELDRDVAVKVILEEKAHSSESRDRFLLEAKITGSLEHPGIVPVYGLGVGANGNPYYAMRLIRGKSLHKEIKNYFAGESEPVRFRSLNQITLRRLLHSIVDACNAVAYAHSRGVLHRDLKPSNIMLGKYGETLVVDWGLAKVLGDPEDTLLQSEPAVVDARLSDSSLTMMGSVLGSPGYMSPEQAQGRLDLLDIRTDVFCLGACLYSILTNRAPFRGNTREETVEAARACHFELPRSVDPTIPEALEAICLRAMAEESSERYQSALLLAEDIDRWIAGEPILAMREPILQQLGRWGKRNQTVVVSTFVLFIASFLGLVISNRVIISERDVATQERDRANKLKVVADDATNLARQERDIAEQAQVRADEANQIAQSNSIAMMDVLEQFVKNLADDRWAAFPQFEKERISMVELAVERVENLFSESPGDRRLFRQLVSLTTRLCHLYRMTGEFTQAKNRMNRVLELCDQIPLKHPNDYAILGDSLSENIYLLEQQLSASDLEPFVQRAIDVCRERIELTPKSDNAKIAMLRALNQKSSLMLRKQDYEASRMASEEAIEVIKPVLPKTRNFAVLLFHVYAYQLLGIAHLKQLNLDEAEASLRHALELAESVISDFPDNNDVIQFRQSVILDVARIHFARQDFDKGFQLLEESRVVFERLANDWDETVAYRRLLSDVQLLIAEYAIEAGNNELASEQLKAAEDFVNNFPEPESMPTHYLPLRLRVAVATVRLASEERKEELLEEAKQARAALESFDPLDQTLADTQDYLQ